MKKLFCLLLVVLIVAASVVPAEAKRRFRLPFFFGGSHSSEHIVFVMDLPNKPQLEHGNGTYVDLGYMFSPSGDRWIGHIGSSTRYLPLTEAKLSKVMAIAGLKELPPIPDKPISMFFDQMFGLLIFGLIAAAALAVLASKILMRNKVDDSEIEAYAKGQLVQHTARDRRIDERINAQLAQVASVAPPSPAQGFGIWPANHAPVSFGKRG
jgi:hypothetical protein